MVRGDDEANIGRRIGEAREAAGLSQGELGAELGLDRSAVNRIERGGRRVTAFELSEMARVLNRRMEWFVSDPAPAIVSFRDRTGTSRRAVDAALEEVSREVQLVASLGGRLPLRTYQTTTVPATVPEAEQLAVAVRAELGLGQGAVKDLVAAAEQLGQLVFSRPLGSDAADGASVLLEQGGIALVNSTNGVGRRRLTLAHEIGHYVVADEYTVDNDVLVDGNGDRESLIDRFARALLCPGGPTREYWAEQRKHHDLRAAALRSASHWRIDFATLARRLLDLQVVDASEAQGIRAAHAVKADYIELDLHVPNDLAERQLSPSFERAVLALYRSETISSARAVELLQNTYEDADLPERTLNPESAAWQVAW